MIVDRVQERKNAIFFDGEFIIPHSAGGMRGDPAMGNLFFLL
jgi:hypothetical protein